MNLNNPRTMRTCKSARLELATLVDGQEASAELAAHLGSCPGCRDLLADLRGVSRALAVADGELRADPAFFARLRQRAEALGLLGALERDRLQRWRRWTLRLVPVTAGALLFLVGSTMLDRGATRVDAFDDLEQGILTVGSPPLVMVADEEASSLMVVLGAYVERVPRSNL